MTISVETGRWVQNFAKRADSFRKGIITADAHPKYTVRIIDTGAEITATAGAAGQSYALHKEVLLQTGGSGRYSRNFTIIGYSQATENGARVPAPDAFTPKTAATITKLPALPVQLVAGGPVQRTAIFGINLTAAPAYGSAGITNAVAVAIDDTGVRLQVQASGATAKGRYSLTIAGKTFPDFFEVI